MSNQDYKQLETRIAKLEEVVFGSSKKLEVAWESAEGKLDWDLNGRAFVRKYVSKLMSGTEKFVLLVAYLAKGDEQAEVSLKDVQQLWGKMTASSLLGMKFNGKYPTDAKTRGWINSSKTGIYELAYGWEEILTKRGEVK